MGSLPMIGPYCIKRFKGQFQMEETKNFADAFRELPPISKAAAILFIIGKIHFIPAATVPLIDRDWGFFFIAVYIACIFSSIVLSLIDMSRMKRGHYDETAPSRKDVEKWAKQYNLI